METYQLQEGVVLYTVGRHGGDTGRSRQQKTAPEQGHNKKLWLNPAKRQTQRGTEKFLKGALFYQCA
jgi:hypothetical protein